MRMPRLERDGEVYVLHLVADDENRFHPDWLTSVEAALDEVDTVTGPRALVTAGSGKFWSNGLDLDWLVANGAQYAAYLDRVNALFARTLASPTITVAALNGHTFAAGAMWALAHDLRIMRADRGFFCLPEVDIDLPFQRGMSDLIRSRLSPAVTHEAMTTGRRYGGEQALVAGIVDAVESSDQLLAAAVALARPLASKAKPNRGQIKETLYRDTLASLRTPTAG
ncbi:MAG TPA: enoyl-CoA hydratase-related protein, partial [Pseudonocardiaceae bacterium]